MNQAVYCYVALVASHSCTVVLMATVKEGNNDQYNNATTKNIRINQQYNLAVAALLKSWSSVAETYCTKACVTNLLSHQQYSKTNQQCNVVHRKLKNTDL